MVFYIFSNNVNEYIVQTMSMKKRLNKLSKSCFSIKKSKITVMPFFKSLNINQILNWIQKNKKLISYILQILNLIKIIKTCLKHGFICLKKVYIQIYLLQFQ